jgi:hypothetical protein
LTTIGLFPGRPALRTPAGLVGESFLGKEFLLGYREDKISATVTTGQHLILKHEENLLDLYWPCYWGKSTACSPLPVGNRDGGFA